MSRIPPPVLALAVVLVAGGLAVVLFVAFGSKTRAPACGDALAAGPYGCVVFSSTEGTESGADVPWLANGTITYSVLKTGDGLHLAIEGGCNRLDAVVTVSGSRLHVGGFGGDQARCHGDRAAEDAWMIALFSGDPVVTEHDDATVTVTNGARSAVFQEVVAQR